jgi:hypothetical protein
MVTSGASGMVGDALTVIVASSVLLHPARVLVVVKVKVKLVATSTCGWAENSLVPFCQGDAAGCQL